jgi:uroporphyrinogen decarboxylase
MARILKFTSGRKMTKNERVAAALKGDHVDSVPVSAWWHDFEREWAAADLAEATLEAYRKYDWDFIKVNPRASYFGEAFGAKYAPREGRQPDLIEPGVSSPDQLKRIEAQDGRSGVWAEQLEALRLIARGLDDEAPFIQTIFSPLATMSRITGSTKYVQRLMRENPEELLAALEPIAETLALYSKASLDAGAAGIFFATVEWGSADVISIEDYNRFARPFDLQVLEGVKDAPFNVLHVCRTNNHISHLLDYPGIAAFHWATHQQGNPSLSEIAAKTERAVMGGVSQEETMTSGPSQGVSREAHAAIEETNGQRFFLAPGCSIDPTTPEANLRALVKAAR